MNKNMYRGLLQAHIYLFILFPNDLKIWKIKNVALFDMLFDGVLKFG